MAGNCDRRTERNPFIRHGFTAPGNVPRIDVPVASPRAHLSMRLVASPAFSTGIALSCRAA
jgi:hypothetical protein